MSNHVTSLEVIPTDNTISASHLWRDVILAGKFENLQNIKSAVNKALRESEEIGSKDSKQFELIFDLSAQNFEHIQSFDIFRTTSELEEYFQMCSVQIFTQKSDLPNRDSWRMFETPTVNFGVRQTDRYSCPRCRLFSATVENELCGRCHQVVN
jgi:hypothetical protein